jgi:hypothetical protein
MIEGNGLPVPTTARSSVQARRSCGVASLRSVGLESGKMIGRLVCCAVVRTTDSEKACGWPDVPINTAANRDVLAARSRRALASVRRPYQTVAFSTALSERAAVLGHRIDTDRRAVATCVLPDLDGGARFSEGCGRSHHRCARPLHGTPAHQPFQLIGKTGEVPSMNLTKRKNS